MSKQYKLDSEPRQFEPRAKKEKKAPDPPAPEKKQPTDEASETIRGARELVELLTDGEGKEDPEATAEMIDVWLKSLAEIRRPGVARLVIELRGLRKNYGSGNS
jgi:hypothetical protein